MSGHWDRVVRKLQFQGLGRRIAPTRTIDAVGANPLWLPVSH
jgi:hypothetical protein